MTTREFFFKESPKLPDIVAMVLVAAGIAFAWWVYHLVA